MNLLVVSEIHLIKTISLELMAGKRLTKADTAKLVVSLSLSHKSSCTANYCKSSDNFIIYMLEYVTGQYVKPIHDRNIYTYD